MINQTTPYRIALVALLLVLCVMQLFGAIGDSQTIDEGTHLASGYSYWKTGDFRLNPEHPPLTKLLASLPLLALSLEPFEHFDSWKNANQWEFARDLLYHNSIDPQSLIFYARLPMIALFLALIIVFYAFCERRFGPMTAFIATLFLALDPNMLAHGRLITTDMSLTLFFFLTILAFIRYVGSPNKKNFLLFAASFTLAQLVKFSAIFLWPILLLLSLIAILRRYKDSSISSKFTAPRALGLGGALLLFFAVTTFVVYRFEMQTVSTIPEVRAYYEIVDTQGFDAAEGALVGVPFWKKMLDPNGPYAESIRNFVYKVPLPAMHYFDGILELSLHNFYGHGTYLLGKTSVFGWWYYFPMTLILKLPFAILLFFTSFLYYFTLKLIRILQKRSEGTSIFTTTWRLWSSQPFIVYALLIPPVFYLLVSMTSHINLGVRHLLPIFPFLYISIAVLLSQVFLKFFYGKVLTALLSVVIIVMAIFTYPNHLSYFSELVGGEREGPKYLLDSNLDWGQGYYSLQEYMRENNLESIRGAFFFSGDFERLGIAIDHLPTNAEVARNGPPSGIIAINIGTVANPDFPFTWLWEYRPVKKIRGSIYIYDLP